MTDQAPWLTYIERNPVHIVAEFTNEQGERFIIYRNEHGDKPFITDHPRGL